MIWFNKQYYVLAHVDDDVASPPRLGLRLPYALEYEDLLLHGIGEIERRKLILDGEARSLDIVIIPQSITGLEHDSYIFLPVTIVRKLSSSSSWDLPEDFLTAIDNSRLSRRFVKWVAKMGRLTRNLTAPKEVVREDERASQAADGE